MIKKLIQQLLKLFYPLVKKLFPFDIYAYLAVGAVNTLLNIFLFTALYFTFSKTVFSVEIATFISFTITVFTGFWLNKNFAFTNSGHDKSTKQKQFGKYFLVSLQGQFSDYLITKGLIIFLVIQPTIAYLISTVIMLTLNYFLQKYFTFKNKKISIIE